MFLQISSSRLLACLDVSFDQGQLPIHYFDENLFEHCTVQASLGNYLLHAQMCQRNELELNCGGCFGTKTHHQHKVKVVKSRSWKNQNGNFSRWCPKVKIKFRIWICKTTLGTVKFLSVVAYNKVNFKIDVSFLEASISVWFSQINIHECALKS